MVAYNFQPRFADDVAAGRKLQTIRQTARAKVGDELQLYTGMRTGKCRLLRRAVCTGVFKVVLWPDRYGVISPDGGKTWPFDALPPDEFAQRDGFKDYAEMYAWFKAAYGREEFRGFLTMWQPLVRH